MVTVDVPVNMDSVFQNMGFNVEARGQLVDVARNGMMLDSLVGYV